jgi:Fur family ferric uptake transcriptional regulator
MEKRIHTRQKAAIQDAFIEADRPLSPDEVLKGAQRHHPSLGIATVYRNIQSLVNQGWLQPVEIPGDSTRYE